VSTANHDAMDGSASGDAGTHRWQAEMTLLGNRFFLADLGKWLGLTLLVCAAIFVPLLGVAGGAKGVEAAFLFLGIGACLLILGTLLFVAIMGNRVPMEFTVDGDGVIMRTVSRRVKGINAATIVLGALARKPGAVGAGVIGASQQSTTIAWDELRRIRFFPAERVIFLKGGIFSRIRVYCTEQNYAAVEATIRQRKPPAADIAAE